MGHLHHPNIIGVQSLIEFIKKLNDNNCFTI